MASPGFLGGIFKFTLHDFDAYTNIALCKCVSYFPPAQNKGSSATGKGGCPQLAPPPRPCPLRLLSIQSWHLPEV